MVDSTKLYSDRRETERHEVRLTVNCRHGDTYLFSRSLDLSELGVFLTAASPLPVGSHLTLEFESPDGGDRFAIDGEVVWIEPGGTGREPGMGIRFAAPSAEQRQRVRELIRTVAYLG